MKNYQKAKLLRFILNGLEKHYNGMKQYLDTLIGYYFFEDLKTDSILIKALDVIKYISENVDEKSEIFFPLLLINSGIGYYKNESTYCFKILSPKMIAKHLKDLMPELFVLYSNSLDEIYGETEKCHGIITININHMYPKLKNNFSLLFYPFEDAEPFLDVSDLSRTVVLFIHEFFGHNKFIYEKNSFLSSPKKFFNKANDYIEMIEIDSKRNEGNQFYKCLSQLDIKYNKGESGQFIEYFFGKCDFGKITRILPLCKKIEGIFEKNNLKYWDDDLKFFRKYIEFKFIGTLMEGVKLYTMERNFENLEKEIKDISKAIKEQEINVDNLIKKYFENCKLPEKKNISENEYRTIINFLTSETQKGIFPFFDYWAYLEGKSTLKCK